MKGQIKIPDLRELLRVLPHRYPFLMVDRVLEINAERVVALKNVALNEPYFSGHFPGRPVMPGVLILEALAQTCALLALSAEGQSGGSLFMLAGLDKARFRRQVLPGDQLKLEVRLLRRHRPLWKMHAEARVEGELVAETELSAMEVDGDES